MGPEVPVLYILKWVREGDGWVVHHIWVTLTHHILGTEGHKLKVSQKPNIDSVTQHESLIEIKLPMKELYAF